MTTSGPPGADSPFFHEFLDDFFAECDEHLVAARRGLLELEPQVNQPQLDGPLLDELFRNFHSIKGLAGMVGLREAERLAHALEGYLRALRQQRTLLTPGGLDALTAGVVALAQIIAAYRNGEPPPEPGPALARLDDITPADTPGPAAASPPPVAQPTAALRPEERAQLQAALERGAGLYQFAFTPDARLAARGITVNVVRERLRAAGQVVRAEPRVAPGGGITFRFLVAGEFAPEDLEAWRADGLAGSPAEPPEVAPELAAPASAGVRAGVLPALSPANVVRVDLERLDQLMQQVGELVVTRQRLVDLLGRLRGRLPAAEDRALTDIGSALERQLRELREGVTRVRLVPVGEAFVRMQFVVRDLTRETGKQVRLELTGQDTQLDKLVVERIMDALLHLVRNALSHGIEPPAERVALGKPPAGRLALHAETAGDRVILSVEDDGRGIDVEQVAARARELGLLAPDAALPPARLLDILSAPGLSTRESADRASGRGVGMAVVRTTVLSLGGELAVDTRPGAGTRFVIQLPLTLAIVDALIVSAGDQTFAVPVPSVREVVEVSPAAITMHEQTELLAYRNGPLPLARLARRFNLEEKPGRTSYALVTGDGAAGLVVDRLLGQQEIVVRALVDPLLHVPGLAGATELGDGRAILILDAAALVPAGAPREGL